MDMRVFFYRCRCKLDSYQLARKQTQIASVMSTTFGRVRFVCGWVALGLAIDRSLRAADTEFGRLSGAALMRETFCARGT